VADTNREKYETDEVISFYERQSGLQESESYLFGRHLRPGAEILDMGVGGGRTTTYLARNAKLYVGADYSEGMVDACRQRFPDLEFRHCDATDMSQFADGAFDIVVFSFNGIDVIPTNEGRARCLAETARVLKPEGLFIFSSHNARILGVWPRLKGASVHRVLWRIVRSGVKSFQLLSRAVLSPTFRSGEGFIIDPIHGGMNHYVSIPETMRPQLESHGFEVIEVVAGPDPSVRSEYFTPWHYYACRKNA